MAQLVITREDARTVRYAPDAATRADHVEVYRRLLESLESFVRGPRVSPGASPLVRIERVNSYFKLKAAEVFNDEASVRLLARLYESHALAYRDLPVNETNGVALARLTAAGFCEVGPLRARITDDGQRFIDNIHQE